MNKIKKLTLTLVLCLSGLFGCASHTDYYAAETQRHLTEKARWDAMGRIAESGDTTAKAVALAVMGVQGNSNKATTAPVNEALQWAQVLVPGFTQVAAIHANMQVQNNQSNNSASVAASTNNTMIGIASKIQSQGAVTTISTSDRHDSIISPTPVNAQVISPVVITPINQVTPVVQITPVIVGGITQ